MAKGKGDSSKGGGKADDKAKGKGDAGGKQKGAQVSIIAHILD